MHILEKPKNRTSISRYLEIFPMAIDFLLSSGIDVQRALKVREIDSFAVSSAESPSRWRRTETQECGERNKRTLPVQRRMLRDETGWRSRRKRERIRRERDERTTTMPWKEREQSQTDGEKRGWPKVARVEYWNALPEAISVRCPPFVLLSCPLQASSSPPPPTFFSSSSSFGSVPRLFSRQLSLLTRSISPS